MKTPFPFFLLGLLLCWGCGNRRTKDPIPLSQETFTYESGAIVRGDTSRKTLALVFTGDQYAEGGTAIRQLLASQQLKASFFLTGNFYRNPRFAPLIKRLVEDGHYLGAHSDKHLLYCDWTRRDSLLVSREEFSNDLRDNYKEMARFGIRREWARYFLPPYEWYNDSISAWTAQEGLQLINITYGTLSHADYTTPEMSNYKSSAEIYQGILEYEEGRAQGLKGFILLVHLGVGPDRKDKFYSRLEELIPELRARGYEFVRIDELLGESVVPR